jgi:hypothetical protein
LNFWYIDKKFIQSLLTKRQLYIIVIRQEEINMVKNARNAKGKVNKKSSTAPREKEILLPPKEGTVICTQSPNH